MMPSKLCPVCKGHSRPPGSECTRCGGRGRIDLCSACEGAGLVPNQIAQLGLLRGQDICGRCGGLGYDPAPAKRKKPRRQTPTVAGKAVGL